MGKLILVGLCMVACVVLSLVFVVLGTALAVDLARNPPQFVRREVIYVLVPVPQGQQQLDAFSRPAVELPQPVQVITPLPLQPAQAIAPLPVQPEVIPTPMAVCDGSYPTLCLIPSSVDTLNCGDVSSVNFPVFPPDPQGFDVDGDGVGCEEN